MQKPLPGPSVMLPALNLSGPPDLDHHINYRKREAQWKRLVSQTHAEWCLCGSYTNHFLPNSASLCTEEKEFGDQNGDIEDIRGETNGGDGDVSEELPRLDMPESLKIYLKDIDTVMFVVGNRLVTCVTLMDLLVRLLLIVV